MGCGSILWVWETCWLSPVPEALLGKASRVFADTFVCRQTRDNAEARFAWHQHTLSAEH